jgi:hypothetical protein
MTKKPSHMVIELPKRRVITPNYVGKNFATALALFDQMSQWDRDKVFKLLATQYGMRWEKP